MCGPTCIFWANLTPFSLKGLGEFIVFIVMLGMLLSKTGLEEAEMLRLSTSLSFVSWDSQEFWTTPRAPCTQQSPVGRAGVHHTDFA